MSEPWCLYMEVNGSSACGFDLSSRCLQDFFNLFSSAFQKQQLSFWLHSKAVLKMALVLICMYISTFLFPTQTVFTDTSNLAEWKKNIWV